MTIPSEISPYLFIEETLSFTDLAGSPLYLAALKALRYMGEQKGVGLTKSGAFNRKFVEWAVDEFQWPGYTADELYRTNKVLNEDDVPPIAVLHDLLKAARLIWTFKGKAVLTKTGKDLIDDPGRLQVVLFETYFMRFDFSEYERWPIEFEDADTFHFLGVIHNRLSDWVTYPEFTGWCLPIFALRRQRGAVEDDTMFYLSSRLVRPLIWLGLLEERRESRLAPFRTIRLRKTDLFDKFLHFELPTRGSSTVH